ncbi:Hypothetical protein LLA12_01377 [Lactococcus lactis subsp. lactis]|nr:Hypothetical protein LLA12_01377 [Lactococcus lactis subsp. lactis]
MPAFAGFFIFLVI